MPEQELEAELLRLIDQMRTGDPQALTAFGRIVRSFIPQIFHALLSSREQALFTERWIYRITQAAIDPDCEFGESIAAWIHERFREFVDSWMARLNAERIALSDLQNRIFGRQPKEVHGLQIGVAFRTYDFMCGDFVEVIEGEDDVVIVLGDAMGHGLPASIFGNRAAGVFSGLALKVRTPSRLLKGANDVLSRIPGAEHAVALAIRWRKGIVRIARGGNVAAVLGRNGRLRDLDVGGFLIGAIAGMTYGEKRLRLDSGDILIGLTDGVSDQENAEKNQFAASRLRELLSQNLHLPAQDLAELVIQNVELHGQGVEESDDQTVVVVRVP